MPERDERGTCSACGREVGVYVPKGGDGTVVYAVLHNIAAGERCPGSRREVQS